MLPPPTFLRPAARSLHSAVLPSRVRPSGACSEPGCFKIGGHGQLDTTLRGEDLTSTTRTWASWVRGVSMSSTLKFLRKARATQSVSVSRLAGGGGLFVAYGLVYSVPISPEAIVS